MKQAVKHKRKQDSPVKMVQRQRKASQSEKRSRDSSGTTEPPARRALGLGKGKGGKKRGKYSVTTLELRNSCIILLGKLHTCLLQTLGSKLQGKEHQSRASTKDHDKTFTPPASGDSRSTSPATSDISVISTEDARHRKGHKIKEKGTGYKSDSDLEHSPERAHRNRTYWPGSDWRLPRTQHEEVKLREASLTLEEWRSLDLKDAVARIGWLLQKHMSLDCKLHVVIW